MNGLEYTQISGLISFGLLIGLIIGYLFNSYYNFQHFKEEDRRRKLLLSSYAENSNLDLDLIFKFEGDLKNWKVTSKKYSLEEKQASTLSGLFSGE